MCTPHTREEEKSSCDPALLDDSVAMKTGWDPGSSGYTKIATHKLVEASPHQLEFRKTIKAYVVSVAILMISMYFLGHAVKSTSLLCPESSFSVYARS